jgi:hypothetical protein
MTAMIVLFWSRATRDLLKSFGWGIVALHRYCSDKVAIPRRPPHSVSRPRVSGSGAFRDRVHCLQSVRRPLRSKWYIDDSDGPVLFGLDIHGQYLLVDAERASVSRTA